MYATQGVSQRIQEVRSNILCSISHLCLQEQHYRYDVFGIWSVVYMVYGYMDVWVYGCMGVWMYGCACMGVWGYGCMGVWVWIVGSWMVGMNG